MPTQMHAVTLCDYHIIVSVQELKRGDWMAATSFKGIPYTARSASADRALSALLVVLRSEI